MGGTCSTHGELRNVYKSVVEKHDKNRLLRILGLDERIFNNLKETVREGVTMWIAFNWLRRKSSGGSLSTRGKKFLEQLSDF